MTEDLEGLEVPTEAAQADAADEEEKIQGGTPTMDYSSQIKELRKENQHLRKRSQASEAAEAAAAAKALAAEKEKAEAEGQWQKVAEIAKAEAAAASARIEEMTKARRDERLASAIELEIAGRLQGDEAAREKRARVMRAAIRAELGADAFDEAGAVQTKAIRKVASDVWSVFAVEAPPPPKTQGAPRARATIVGDPLKPADPRSAMGSILSEAIENLGKNGR